MALKTVGAMAMAGLLAAAACTSAPPAQDTDADKARFVQGDMFEADISLSSVLALFLLSENMNKLTP